MIISSRVCWGYGGLKLKKRHTVDTVAVRGVAARCVCGEVRLQFSLSVCVVALCQVCTGRIEFEVRSVLAVEIMCL